MKSTDIVFDALPKGNISEIIIERITEALIDGRLKPGDKIPTEVEFSERLGVGRNTVREAIKVLVAFGVLEIRRAEGTFVTKEYNHKLLDPIVYGLILANKSMEDLLEFKITFLNAMLYSGIRKIDENDIKELQIRCDSFRNSMMDEKSDIDEKYEKSKSFYSYLGVVTKNPLTEELNEIVLKISKYSRVLAIENSITQGTPMVLADSYQRIINTLKKGDCQKIGPLIDDVLSGWRKLLI